MRLKILGTAGARLSGLALVGLLVAPAAHAATYNVDINSVPTVPGTGGYYIAGHTGGGGSITIGGYQTPIYLLDSLGLPQNSTVNLGTLIVNPVYVGDQYGDRGVYEPAYNLYGGQASDLYKIPDFLCYAYQSGCILPTVYPAIVPLIFGSGSEIQFSFVNGYIDVPEPSTWAMLLIGFAGIGFAAHRRRWAL
jgi:hypothetical protein